MNGTANPSSAKTARAAATSARRFSAAAAGPRFFRGRSSASVTMTSSLIPDMAVRMARIIRDEKGFDMSDAAAGPQLQEWTEKITEGRFDGRTIIVTG
ncbi:MAG: hypothetical protein ACTHU7_08315, partial [Microbacterium sp.]